MRRTPSRLPALDRHDESLAGKPGAAPTWGPEPAVAAPPGHRRFPLIDSLRGGAALFIIVGHALGLAGVLDDAWFRFLFRHNPGLVIFFMVSGFVIYRPFVAHRVLGARDPGFRSLRPPALPANPAPLLADPHAARAVPRVDGGADRRLVGLLRAAPALSRLRHDGLLDGRDRRLRHPHRGHVAGRGLVLRPAPLLRPADRRPRQGSPRAALAAHRAAAARRPGCRLGARAGLVRGPRGPLGLLQHLRHLPVARSGDGYCGRPCHEKASRRPGPRS